MSFWKNKKVLITGHTGFKGSWLSLWLQSLGAKVIGYALEPPTQPSLFQLAHVQDGMISIHGDVRNYEQLYSAFEQHALEIVFHMAAQPLVRASYRDPLETYSTNVMGTANVLEAIRQSRCVKAAVIITTDKCYENKEWHWGYRENDRLGGFDPYSNSKACAELVTASYRHSFFKPDRYAEHGVAVASVRAGNVIGGGDWAEDRLIPDLIRGFIRNKPTLIRYPDAVRPWQHVLEPLYGYMLLAEKMFTEGPALADAWNFGPYADDEKSVGWVADKMAQLWDSDVSWARDGQPHPHEAGYLKLDWSKARQMLHWRPVWRLEDALIKIVEWYQAYQKQSSRLRELTLEQIHQYQQKVMNG